MTPENFVYWLQGFMELQNPETISSEQVEIIQDHLNLVFKKETPIRKVPLKEKYESLKYNSKETLLKNYGDPLFESNYKDLLFGSKYPCDPLPLPSGVIQKDCIPSSKETQLYFNFDTPVSC